MTHGGYITTLSWPWASAPACGQGTMQAVLWVRTLALGPDGLGSNPVSTLPAV